MTKIAAPKLKSPRSTGVVTMHEVARAAGVAPMTVSYAFSGKRKISDETRARVLKLAQDLGYQPNPHAQRLAGGQSHDLIGLFVSYLDLGVQGEKLRAIQGALVESGFEVPIYTGGFAFPRGEAAAALMNGLRRQNPRAIVCNTVEIAPETLQELRLYQQSGGLVVCYDSPTDLECDRVVFDRQNSTGDATRHLLKLGHRAIGYFHHSERRTNTPRYQGFCAALQHYGLEARDQWKFSASLPLHPERAGEALAAQFLALPASNRPTGAVIVNDLSALTFIGALQKAGVRVPDDVSVVGHDDRPIARHAVPALSSAAHPVEELGQSVVRLLRERLDGYDGAPREIVVRGELKIRDSSAPPKASR